jgi:acyl carrier protein
MGLDSVELVMEIENFFKIRIEDKDAEKIYTVGDMTEHVSLLLNITSSDRNLFDNTLNKITSFLGWTNSDDFINNDITKYINFSDDNLLADFKEKVGLTIPFIPKKTTTENVFGKIKTSITNYFAHDWTNTTVKDFIEIILAENIKDILAKRPIQSKYEVYLGVSKVTVDKIGVDYSEINPNASFTSDLGID